MESDSLIATFGQTQYNQPINSESLSVHRSPALMLQSVPFIDKHTRMNLTPKLPAGYLLEDGTQWLYEQEIIRSRFNTILGTIAAGEVVGILMLRDVWYHHKTTKFHTMNFKNDMERDMWMDKFGHFLHAYFATGLLSRGFRWAGMEGSNSILYGGLVAWLWILQIEIADAFFLDWGFSWGDFIANTVGVGFSVLQQLYPSELGGLQPKISYHVSDAYRENRYTNNAKWILDDYEGMTFWMAVNIHHYMPSGIQQTFPDWLKPVGLAVGHSAKGIAEFVPWRYREIYIGLDYDLRKIPFGDDNNFIRFLKNELNIIRLPLPAVKISPDGVWYGLYF